MNTEKYFGFIYVTENKINGKKYIGKCKFKRKNGWKNYLGSGIYLKRAIKKYGVENFEREIVFLAMNEEELNEIEEFMLNFYDAENNEKFYNIKNSSIGGDTFTSNPRREEIRKKHSIKNSGVNNNMYGVEKSEKMIQSIKEANSIPIIINGVTYNSSAEFSKVSGINTTTINYRLSSDGFPNYKYLDDDKNKSVRKPIVKKGIEINDVSFVSIYEASKILGISRTTIRKRLESDKYPTYLYI